MRNKLRIKIIAYTISSLFILLLIAFLIINISNFSAVASEADKITEMIQKGNSIFNEDEFRPQPDEFKTPFGPDSPELGQTIRYFVYKFDKKNNATLVKYQINNYTEEQALNIANSLLKNQDKTGWINTIYRYRVYTDENYRYVVVIDQSRELNPSYRILWLSLAVLFGGSLLALLILIPLSKKIIQPVIESDNKQKRFIKDATRNMKIPLTIIEESNELLKENDEENTKTISKQLNDLNLLLSDMNSLTIFQDLKTNNFQDTNINEQMQLVLDNCSKDFENNNINLECNIQDDINHLTDAYLFRKMFKEIIDNGLKYSKSFFQINVSKVNDRLSIESINDLKDSLKDGPQDRVFERFYRIDSPSKETISGNGMGLALVKEIISLHHGRASAKINDNKFILKIEL